MTNPLLGLAQAGQSIWLDYFNPKILKDGELTRLIKEDGLMGMTINPSIFEKSIAEDRDYDGRVKALLEMGDLAARDLYEKLAVADVQAAADQFRPVYDRLEGADGYVSLEVSPYLAMDTEASVAEARRLWRAVDRPNLMIKIPGTKTGVPAIRQLVGEGININVTLLFGIDAYLAVADAHMAGLESLNASGGDISKVHGVASFFVSRIDTQIDKEIDRRIEAREGPRPEELKALRGKVAIANAKVAYQHCLEILKSARWKRVAVAGAPPQRLLWASTGTKDAAYSDVLYVESLIGANTINTIPLKTLDAFRDHGRVRPTLTESLDEARNVLHSAERLGLDLNGVTERLVTDGLRQFTTAFDKLLAALVDKRAQFVGGELSPQTLPVVRAASVPTSTRRPEDRSVNRRG
jgi:transaldolase / glucose-6-phosphate isomerase